MRTIFIISLCFTFFSCTHNRVDNVEKSLNDSSDISNKQSLSDSKERIAYRYDSLPMYEKLSDKIIVKANVTDSELVIFKEKCVVFSVYSDNEMDEFEKDIKNKDDWETYYDDLSFYLNEASQFLSKKTKVEAESRKKYIQFILTSGEKITINRYLSVGTIFFFNPKTGVKQCDWAGFDQNKYTDY
jgi:hypothetical protein